MRNILLRRICLDGMLLALYIVLTFLSIRIGNIRITIAPVATVFAAVYLPFPHALLIVALGEFINQFKYGLGPTTALWCLPPVIRVCIVGLTSYIFRKKGTTLDRHPVWFYAIAFFAAIAVTATNTLVMFLDAKIYQYRIEFVWLETMFRFLSSMIGSIVTTSVALILVRTIRKIDVAEELAAKTHESQRCDPPHPQDQDKYTPHH